MGKFLILVLIIAAVYVVWRALRHVPGPRNRSGSSRAPGERMVDCSQCGLHLPVSEAVESQGRYFCSDEHRRLFKQ